MFESTFVDKSEIWTRTVEKHYGGVALANHVLLRSCYETKLQKKKKNKEEAKEQNVDLSEWKI